MNELPISVYLHIPFCQHRCGYCDFNTYAGLGNLIPAYVDAICQELISLSQKSTTHLPISTIFFGGGTPSLLTVPQLRQILECMEKQFYFQSELEITLEANPGTLSAKFLNDLRALGVNRLSIGMQSSRPDELRLLERQHSYFDVVESMKWARLSGFDNINLDLIFGLPEQQLTNWQQTLELAIGLQPDHFSLYSLTIEHGTPLAALERKGLISKPDEDSAADMYEWSMERLEMAGWKQSEISNWARSTSSRSYSCQHNLQYWRNLPYIGVGAGAHGFIAELRTVNVLSPQAYIQRLKQNEHDTLTEFPLTQATQSFQQITQEAEIAETMMMGLRLVDEGIPEMKFLRRFGVKLETYFHKPIQRLVGIGLLEWKGIEPDRTLRLTQKGKLLGNQVFMEFI
jgi:oxygen-independent coproporphyrinogen-3 oxidase